MDHGSSQRSRQTEKQPTPKQKNTWHLFTQTLNSDEDMKVIDLLATNAEGLKKTWTFCMSLRLVQLRRTVQDRQAFSAENATTPANLVLWKRTSPDGTTYPRLSTWPTAASLGSRKKERPALAGKQINLQRGPLSYVVDLRNRGLNRPSGRLNPSLKRYLTADSRSRSSQVGRYLVKQMRSTNIFISAASYARREDLDRQTVINRINRGELMPVAYLKRSKGRLTPLFLEPTPLRHPCRELTVLQTIL